jgi:hypothetical protein
MARALTSDLDFDNSAPVSPSDDINGMYTPLKKKPNELKDDLINPKERNAKNVSENVYFGYKNKESHHVTTCASQ